jgi:DNA-binding CsgD family transcriptional regulator
MNKKKSGAALRALCGAGLPAEVLVPTLLELLHDLVPSYRNLFDWTDEDGALVRYFIEGPVDETVARHYFDEFHNRRESEVMPSFADLRHARAGVRSAAELNHAGFFNSALYTEIWRPQGFRYRLEAVLRGSRGQLIGSLVLYRHAGDRCFSRAEEAQLAELVPVIASALESSGPATTQTQYVGHRDGPQTLVMSLDGQVQHASAGARRLLMLAQGGITRSRLELPLQMLGGTPLRLLLAQLRRPITPQGKEPAPAAQPPMLTHENAWGMFSFSATLLQALSREQQPLVLATLAWSEPHRVALERALRTLPLTPGQMAVCRELYEGKTQAAIGDQLGVAPATVVDHVRKLYRTLNVRSTLELRAALDRAIHGPVLHTHS